jgi:coniferyl-aldehyde dehydrogenase
MIPSAAPFGGVGRSGMRAYHGKAGFDAFSHYRTVVGTDLPFSVTGLAAPPFGGPMKAGVGVALRMAPPHAPSAQAPSLIACSRAQR